MTNCKMENIPTPRLTLTDVLIQTEKRLCAITNIVKSIDERITGPKPCGETGKTEAYQCAYRQANKNLEATNVIYNLLSEIRDLL